MRILGEMRNPNSELRNPQQIHKAQAESLKSKD